jgi:hypothetical protein
LASALPSFIVGLGIAQLLTSISEAVRSRIDHPLHWMPFAWAVPILLLSVQHWFALFDLDTTIGDWNWCLQMLALAMALFMAAALILPPRESSATGGLLKDFMTHCRFSLLALVVYLLGWIPANSVMNGGDVLDLANLGLFDGCVLCDLCDHVFRARLDAGLAGRVHPQPVAGAVCNEGTGVSASSVLPPQRLPPNVRICNTRPGPCGRTSARRSER